MTKAFVIGHDVIAQAIEAAVYYLAYDGHGSTRMLLDAGGDVATYDAGNVATKQLFAYDAYGQMLETVWLATLANSATNLLYSGEQTDANTGMQYLRARYYDPGLSLIHI